MQPIIRQNVITLELPNFRNLGTILRIVLAVNAMTAVAALVKAPQLDLWTAHWLDLTAVVEPHLIAVLAVLYALAPWLGRQSSSTGALAVAAIVVAIGLGVHTLVAREVPEPPLAVLRHLLIALSVYATLLAYFGLRAKALSPAIAESRLQALQARIRPHFLFNSLNAVLSLIRSEPRRAEGALLDMADLFRVLMRDNRDLVPLADEIELCRQYLGLEKLRLSDRLSVEWHLKNMPGDALVPPLMLQPLLENAVYHGIEPSSTPGVVSINIFLKGGDVHAILRNPYQAEGGRHHAGNKMALANIRERLKLHFDAESSLESRVRDAAYEVHIRIPYRAAKVTSARALEPSAAAGRRNPDGETPAARSRLDVAAPALLDRRQEVPHG
ncbi:MAG: histidine kinase [Betaproteobacteria bacterium]|jgi:two-component system sensor histidine kinase AlgZ|nr:histidine kinase [Betaproteobacteria bacterium]